MATKAFDIQYLTEILGDWECAPPEHPVLDGGPTGQTFENDRVTERWMVFEHEGKFYRCTYRVETNFYRDCGDEVTPFGHLEGVRTTVECTEVVPREVMTIVYEDAP